MAATEQTNGYYDSVTGKWIPYVKPVAPAPVAPAPTGTTPYTSAGSRGRVSDVGTYQTPIHGGMPGESVPTQPSQPGSVGAGLNSTPYASAGSRGRVNDMGIPYQIHGGMPGESVPTRYSPIVPSNPQPSHPGAVGSGLNPTPTTPAGTPTDPRLQKKKSPTYGLRPNVTPYFPPPAPTLPPPAAPDTSWGGGGGGGWGGGGGGGGGGGRGDRSGWLANLYSLNVNR